MFVVESHSGLKLIKQIIVVYWSRRYLSLQQPSSATCKTIRNIRNSRKKHQSSVILYLTTMIIITYIQRFGADQIIHVPLSKKKSTLVKTQMALTCSTL